MPDPADSPADWRALVVMPTYNEAENITTAVSSVLAAQPELHVLIVDDSSPDGTGTIADSIAEDDDRVHVLHRLSKDGLGRAYLDGFEWGLARHYDAIVEMDADGSHPADRLGALLAPLITGRASLSIGSRWVPGGAVVDWPAARQALSRGGNRYVRMLLGISVRDATAGYRAYTADLLRRWNFSDVHSHGYCFQIEMTLRAIDAGARVVEIPIVFRERRRGKSKMSRTIVAEAMLRVTWWGFLRRSRSLLRARRSFVGFLHR